MTLPLFGSMGEFDPSTQTFTVCERFEPRSHFISICNVRKGTSPIARVCKKRRVNTSTVEKEDKNGMSKTEISVPGEECMNTLNVEGELLEESSSCMRLSRMRRPFRHPVCSSFSFKTVCPYVKLKPTALSTYTGETVRPLVEAFVHVQHSGWQRFPPVLVVEGGKSASFGRNWLMDVNLDWKYLLDLNLPSSIPSAPLRNNNDELFQPQHE
ncbi:unnamed protein product [Porites evermanni]|uniref:Uncharacterized protein n=1 Tax=Porites evermanni TaxID=104178 RepID=A0ABN8LM91_9CNID|nr:unnamed protein product [Porites evermanni]